MKELSIEEKAKRYDELKVTAQELEHDGCFDKITLFDLFPELKESEDEKIRKELLDFCKNRAENYPNDPKYKNISAWIAWLEKQALKDRVQPKQEWSEKDERIILAISQLLKDCESENGWNCVYYNDKEVFFVDMENWLKSIKPQNRWKPSDKQMEALDSAQAELCSTEYNKPICDLIDALNKLKE